LEASKRGLMDIPDNSKELWGGKRSSTVGENGGPQRHRRRSPFNLDTSKLTNGQHTMSVRGYSSGGTQVATDEALFKVRN
jgi:hypothetical protein